MKQTLRITEYFLLTQEEFNNIKTTEKIPMKCSVCEKTYYKTKKDALQHFKRQKTANLYCSSKCFTQPIKNIINCLHCNKEFEKIVSNKDTRDKKFCSKSCCAIYMNINRVKRKINSKLRRSILNQTTSRFIAFNTSVYKNKVKKKTSKKIKYKQLTINLKNVYTLLHNLNYIIYSNKIYKSTCKICKKELLSIKKMPKICSQECHTKLMKRVHKERPHLILNRSNSESYLEKSFREYIESNGYIKNDSYFQEKHWTLSSGKRYISDFYFPNLNLIIEMDGKQHQDTIEEDKLRDQLIFNELNIKTIRITHKEWVKKLKHAEIDKLLF